MLQRGLGKRCQARLGPTRLARARRRLVAGGRGGRPDRATWAATAVIEGACRHLKDGTDITAARWGVDGAEAVLKLRSLISNGDFDTYWTHHLTQEQHRLHAVRYLRESMLTRT